MLSGELRVGKRERKVPKTQGRKEEKMIDFPLRLCAFAPWR